MYDLIINQAVALTLVIGFVYVIISFIIGVLWYKGGMVLAEAEVGNQFNLFTKEMRKSIKK